MIRLLLLLPLLWMGGCVSQTVKSTSVPPLDSPTVVVADNEVLDVGIAVFDPGIEVIDEAEPIFPEVRRAEANFMAEQLRNTLQEVGAWGAVRVVPNSDQFNDLLVEAKILHSDGERLELDVTVTDARGVRWIDKVYDGVTSRYAYSERVASAQDPFVMVYRAIANDMLKVFNSLSPRDRVAIRQVAELRFARAFSEAAFADYLTEDDNGVYRISRLPAENDPMLERVRTLRQRNYVFVDTLQGNYTAFTEEMQAAYLEWRKLSYADVIERQKLQREATRDLVIGTAAVVGGVVARNSSNGITRGAGNLGVAGGAYILKEGLDKRNQVGIYTNALEELGQSLEAEISPKVIKLEDRTVTLVGSAEDQYAQWRELMADIYAAEIGTLEPSSLEAGQRAP